MHISVEREISDKSALQVWFLHRKLDKKNMTKVVYLITFFDNKTDFSPKVPTEVFFHHGINGQDSFYGVFTVRVL